jgi:hypothetical protein
MPPVSCPNGLHLLRLPRGLFGFLALRDHFRDSLFEIFIERTQFGFGTPSPDYIDRTDRGMEVPLQPRIRTPICLCD